MGPMAKPKTWMSKPSRTTVNAPKAAAILAGRLQPAESISALMSNLLFCDLPGLDNGVSAGTLTLTPLSKFENQWQSHVSGRSGRHHFAGTLSLADQSGNHRRSIEVSRLPIDLPAAAGSARAEPLELRGRAGAVGRPVGEPGRVG